MTSPKETCTDCGFHLLSLSLGSASSQAVCPNHYCPGKFADTCPACHSTHKSVRLAGMGNAAFTCLDCGQGWDNRRGVTCHVQGNIVSLNFRKSANAPATTTDQTPPAKALPFARPALHRLR